MKKAKPRVYLSDVVRIMTRERNAYREAAQRCTCMDDPRLHSCAEGRVAGALDETMGMLRALVPPQRGARRGK